MEHNRFKGAFFSSLAAAGLALFLAGPLFAQQSTGKVQGRVVDEDTGAPIAGASVTVVGTQGRLANLTNDQGYYFLNEVPAGLQTIRAEFIGYRAVEITDERILAGQTTTLNFSLSSTAVELQALVVEGERNPLVPRDQTSTKSIIQGEQVYELPLDNTNAIVVLQPGVVETNQGRTIRGGRANEEAVIIDGVLTRGFGTGVSDNIQLPTNALRQVDVNVGAFSAEYGEGQSGVVSFVTRSGGPDFTGSLQFETDELSPSDMRRNLNQGGFNLGGPIAGPLTFFVAGTAAGRQRVQTTDAPNSFVIDGFDTCPNTEQFSQYQGLCTSGEPAVFRLPRGSATPGVSDSVDVAAPNFVEWDNGRTLPFGWSQSDLFHGNLNWQLPRGSRISVSYNRNRDQGYGHGGFTGNYNPDGVNGSLKLRNSVSLSWFQTITQTAQQQLAFDFLAAYSVDEYKQGMLDQRWWVENQDPLLGFRFPNVEFAYDERETVTGFDLSDISEEMVNAYRSNAIPSDSLRVFGQRTELRGRNRQLTALSSPFLRYNPYGQEDTFDFVGAGFTGLTEYDETRLQFRGSIDWQLGRFNRIKAGGEYIAVDLQSIGYPLAAPDFPGLDEAEPTKVGAFLQNRLDIGDLVIEAGVRYDRLDPDAEYPLIPGYVFNVPDSLKAGFVRFDTETGSYVPLTEPCNGAAVCKTNFFEGETKSEWSPRLGASFPVTPTSTFRLSYGRFVQTPAFFTGGSFLSGDVGETGEFGQANFGLLQDANGDLQLGGNTNSTFARDVELPSTRTFEFGYRQLIGEDLVIDISAFNKKQRGALSSRKLPYTDPINGATVFVNSLTNADFTESNGFEIKMDKAIGDVLTSNLSYSFLDARGTGTDPFFYEDLLLRATTNLSGLTGEPVDPPEVLLTLEQSRSHNISWTNSLVFPADFREGTTAGALLQDLGIFTIMRVRSGLPFTKLQNLGDGQIGPPSRAGLFAILDGEVSGNETPWIFELDLRVTKGLSLGESLNLVAFADWRNPFDLSNTSQVFLETANTINELHREQYLADRLRDSSLDGLSGESDFDIRLSPDNDFNRFMLMRAEQRFGDGDGIFTIEEQREAFGQLYDATFGRDVRFERSDQSLRLGLRLEF